MKILQKNKFVELYSIAVYVISFVGVIASITYALRRVRGSYQWFQLTDHNAVLFFMGALLAIGAIFFSLVRLIGPISFSASEIFWRFSGISRLPGNPWCFRSTWVVLGLWSFIIFVMANIFAPASIFWLLGSVVGAICFGVLLIQGVAAHQILNSGWLLEVWALMTGGAGVLITLVSTAVSFNNRSKEFSFYVASGTIIIGVILLVFLVVKALGKPVDKMAVTKAHSQKNFLLAALSNFSSPAGYKYYGSKTNFFRRKITPCNPILTSLVSLLDNYAISLYILAFSIPLGIFFGIAFGLVGVGGITVLGAWTAATLYRWIVREWTAQPSLRAWLGGSYIKLALEYALGPALATCLYVVAMTLIFSLPLHAVAIAFVFGLTVSLGEPNPPSHVDYDLVIMTQDGVMIQMETAKAFITNTAIITSHLGSIMLGPVLGILLALIILLWRVGNHWKKVS